MTIAIRLIAIVTVAALLVGVADVRGPYWLGAAVVVVVVILLLARRSHANSAAALASDGLERLIALCYSEDCSPDRRGPWRDNRGPPGDSRSEPGHREAGLRPRAAAVASRWAVAFARFDRPVTVDWSEMHEDPSGTWRQ